MKGHVGKILIVCLAGLMFCVASHEGAIEEGFKDDTRTDALIDYYFDAAFNHLMKAWYVMDLLRKITIDPVARAPFIGGSVEHLICMLSSIAGLEACCHMNGGIWLSCTQKFEDLSWRLNGLTDAFGSVCTPLKPEEQVLGSVLQCARQLLNACALPLAGSAPLKGRADRKAGDIIPYNIFTA